MAEVNTALIKELRERTGAGMLDCKNALVACDGDTDKAIDFLREKGLAAAAKKEGRIAAEGLVESYIHGGGRIGVLLEVNCETDFVARSEDYRRFVRDIAMQIAAARPEYINASEVPAEVLEHEREIVRAQTLNEGKPAAIAEKMIEGRMSKFFQEVCLMEQPFVKEPDKAVKDILLDKISKVGEKISIRRFARFELGEGIEKKQSNFVDEVMKEIER
ncbi:MAG: translation elongation factor Ts [Gracilibacteraceae bacterium]|jgi:elongation factor Ts|nr:translation elongation factor Ts [Gracilibacteraceae bacterium]